MARLIRLKNSLTVMLVFFLGGYAWADVDTSQNRAPKVKEPFVAELLAYNERDPKASEKVDVVFSEYGIRMSSSHMLGKNRPGIYIQNFAQESAWIIDSQKRHYAKLEVDEGEGEESDRYAGGVMSTEPCLDWVDGRQPVKKYQTETLVENDDVIAVWQCDYSGYKVKQYFSHKYGVVMKEVTQNLDVSVLNNIKGVSFHKNHFLPSQEHLEVGLKELYAGYEKLKTYVE